MKHYLLLVLLLMNLCVFGQIVSVNPNQADRGQSLITTITPMGAMMTISSGMGSSYHFSLEQGSYVIPEAGYTVQSSGLGFASAVNVTFIIPFNALPGLYDVHIKNNFWVNDAVLSDGFTVNENGFGGRVFFDSNQNGIYDSLEYGIENQTISITPQNIQTLTGANGKYSAFLSAGTYKDSLVLPPNFIYTSPSSFTVTVPPDTIRVNFGLYTPPSSIYNHDFVTTFQRIRCNRQAKAFWTVKSNSNNIQNGTVTLIYNTPLTFISSQPSPTSVSLDTIRWNYTLQPFQILDGTIIFQGGPVNTFANYLIIDSMFDGTGALVSTAADTNNYPLLCSYDPNDKSVMPEGIDSIAHYTLKTDELKYTIRFQNCGNDTAFNISIRDTIKYPLDISMFHILYSSSPVTTQIEGNRILFSFENILLPDSGIDEIHSHGLIVYSIKANANVPDFTIAKNTAYIYFDLNDPIVTNSTVNTLVSQLNVGMEEYMMHNSTNVFPNPITGESIIILPDEKYYQMNIFNSTGELLSSKLLNTNQVLNKNEYLDGIYYYQLIEERTFKIFIGKFVVIR